MTPLFDNSEKILFFNGLLRTFKQAIENYNGYISRKYADKIIKGAVYLETSQDPDKFFKCERSIYRQASLLYDLGGVYLRSIDVDNITIKDYQFMLYLLNSPEGEPFRLFSYY